MNAERILHGAGRNPFYLLSALFMLLGCFALSHHLTLVPGQWKPLLILMGVLQIYEFFLLGLARLLNRRAHARTDSTTLLLLVVMFLVDVTHLNAELAASNPWVAPWVALGLHGLAAVKLVFLREALGLRSRRALAVALAQLGVLLYLPGAASTFYFTDAKLRALGAGPEVLPLLLYGLWWLVGCIPIAFVWTDRKPERGASPGALGIARAALLLPFGSIVLHFLSLHWLYDLAFPASYATPLLLGASTYAAFTFVRKNDPLRFLLQWVAPVFALLFSLYGADLAAIPWNGFELVITPFRVALAGLAVVWFLHRELDRDNAFGWAAAGSLLMAFSGHAPGTMVKNWASVVPETGMELGIASILVAFAFLALGLAKSLLPARSDSRTSTAPDV